METINNHYFEGERILYGLEDAELDASAIDPIIKQLEAHNMVQLGEHSNNDLEVSRRILQRAISSKAA